MRLRTPAARLAVVAFSLGVTIGVAGFKLAAAEGAAASKLTAAEGVVRPAAAVHLVEPAETLWDLARRYGDPGEDPRAFIVRLEQLNRLNGPLLAGQLLRVPSRAKN